MDRITSSVSNNTQFNIDLIDIRDTYIEREEQSEQFRYRLNYWIQCATRDTAIESPNTAKLKNIPSPEDPIQGLVILLTGTGGSGKSALLKHYNDIADKLNENEIIQISERIDWSYVIGNKRVNDIESSRYFDIMHMKLTYALGKKPNDFSEYVSTYKKISDTKNKIVNCVNGLRQQKEYAWLGNFATGTILLALGMLPIGKPFLQIPEFPTVVHEIIDIEIDKIVQLRTRLKRLIGREFDSYLETDSESLLSISLGRDLARFAQERPILIFFDTYETIADGDKWLRMIMGVAGERVGWVIAGRNRLWKRGDTRKRNNTFEYAYEDIVSSGKGLEIDLDKVGLFDNKTIIVYFTALSNKVRMRRPGLPHIDEGMAKAIHDTTLGVPLAVSIAAKLYLEKGFDAITVKREDQYEIIDEMVDRYLSHRKEDKEDRIRLYALALHRRPEEVKPLLAALNVPPDKYDEELHRLHRRYGFIFDSQERKKPILHEKVRKFLRLWLLSNRTISSESAIIQEVARRLRDEHYNILNEYETTHKYMNVEQRLQDARWVGLYLDLAEQEFWVDPDNGVNYLLPFMVSATLYKSDENKEAETIGRFFEDVLHRPFDKWWSNAKELITPDYGNLDDKIRALKGLALLIEDQYVTFPLPVQIFRANPAPGVTTFHDVLIAALWWNLGNAYLRNNPGESVSWYKKATELLPQNEELSKAYTEATAIFKERAALLEQIIEIEGLISNNTDPTDLVSLYSRLGDIYTRLRDFIRAKDCYSKALSTNRSEASIFYKLGRVYRLEKVYQLAIANFTEAITNFTFTSNIKIEAIYGSRGEAHLLACEFTEAIQDFNYVLRSEPDNKEILKLREEAIRRQEEAIKEQSRRQEEAIREQEEAKLREEEVRKLEKQGELELERRKREQGLKIRRRSFLKVAIGTGILGGFLIAIGADIWIMNHHGSDKPRTTGSDTPTLTPTITVYSGHTASIYSVVWSPNGQNIASASDDKTVQVWNASSGQKLFTYRNHPKAVNSVAWSSDGKHIASASDDQTIQVWDPFSGTVFSICRGHSQGVNSVAWSPDGKYIVSASSDRTARIWDAFSGKSLFILRGHSQNIWSVDWSPDGNFIASASADKTVRIWSTTTGKSGLIYRGHNDMVIHVAWSPDGMNIASASYDRTVQIWNASRGKMSYIYRGHSNWVATVNWSPDGKRIASGGYDKTVQEWDPFTGKNIFIYRYPTGNVFSLAWSPNGKRIASAGDDTTVHLWNAFTGLTTVNYQHHTNAVWSALWSPDGKRIASASDDKTAQVWDASGHTLLIYTGHTDAVYDIAWSPNGKWIASSSHDAKVRIWDAETGKTRLVYKGHAGAVRSVIWSPDGKFIASAGDDKTIQVWNPLTGTLITTYKNHQDVVYSLSLSPDGKHIASASGDRTSQIWEVSTGKTLQIYKGHSNAVLGIAWSPDGTRVASAGIDTTVQIWDVTTGLTALTYRAHTLAVEAINWSLDGQYIASASDDTTVQVWEVSTGNKILIYQKHSNVVNDVVWSLDGASIVSASSDKTAQVWDWPPVFD